MDPKLLEELFYWMEERHKIYLAKEAGEPKPWTQDEILLNYRFCNVFRELDKVTVWFKENIIGKWEDNPYLWFALCLGRRINLPETLAELGDLMIDWDADSALDILDARKARGEQIYSSAYMLTTGGRKVPKNEDTCFNILEPLWEKRDEITDKLSECDTLESAFKVFNKGHVGYSDFIAYEVVSDLRYSSLLKDAKDVMTWANHGPGATRGLNRLYGRDINKKIKACQAVADMRYLLEESQLYLPDWFPELELRDIEHSLCEFDKYQRVKTQSGFLRQKYNGRG